MSEDVIDCVPHVVDVRLSVDLLTVSVYHNCSLGFLGRPSDFFFVLVSLPCNFVPGSSVHRLWWSGVCAGIGLLLRLGRGLFLCALGVNWLSIGIGSGSRGSSLCWFTLGSAHSLYLLLQTSVSLFEVVVLVFEGGSGGN